MIPIVFIVQGSAGNKKTMGFIALAIVVMFILSKNPALADMFLEGTEYEGALTEMQRMGDDGVNPIRVLVECSPGIFGISTKKAY